MKEWEAEVQHSLVLFSHAWWWGTLQIALREVIITEVSLHFSAVLLDWTDLKENLMKQLSVKWLYRVVDVLSTVFIPLTAFLFPISPVIYQCNNRAAKKFCWNSLFSPLSTAFSFSNCYFFYIPWLPINSSKRRSLFESQSLSQVLLRIWFILGARVRLFSTKNCQRIGGLSCVKVPGVNGLIAIYILLFLYTGIIDTIITPFYGGKSTKKEQKRTISSLFLCKNKKKKNFLLDEWCTV